MVKGKKKVQSQKSKVQRKSKVQPWKISPARTAAFEILLKIAKDKAFSSVLLPLYEANLEAKDRALCHQLTLGTLRRQIYLDKVTEKFTKKTIEKFDSEVLVALRLGLFQLIFLDKIPAYSAINESVNLVRRAKKSSAAGFINAVLRRADREKTFDFRYSDEIERVSTETSHPRWLIEHWTKSFGLTETEKIAAANNLVNGISFRLTDKSNEKTIEILTKINLEISKSEISHSGWQANQANEMLLAYAREGEIYFQEESSQLVAEMVNVQAGESFLDVCAAPGSKTTLIASLRRKGETEIPNSKFQIPNLFIAGDLREHRLRILRETVSRTGAKKISIVAYDAEKSMPFADESFDCILIDAPCSGTGTIRHNPEIRYFVEEKDFFELQKKQLQILNNASKLLKKDGRIIYSTCSLEKAENEEVIKKFLSGVDNFHKTSENLPERFLTAEGFARTFPSRDRTDGFFIARLVRR